MQFTISYYESLADAESNTNPILDISNYNPPSNPQTVFARVFYNPLPICYETTTFEVIVGQNPTVSLAPTYLSCQSQPVTLNAGNGNLPTTSYQWSDGTTTPDLTISTIGSTSLTVTATNVYGISGQRCSTSQQILVTISDVPTIERVETVD